MTYDIGKNIRLFLIATGFLCLNSTSAMAQILGSSEYEKIKVDFYPDAAVHLVEQQTQKQLLRLDELNDIAAQKADEYERNKIFAEQEVLRKKLKIEGAKVEQTKLLKEIQFMESESAFVATEVAKTNDQLTKIQTELETFMLTYNNQKSDFEAKKYQYDQQLASLETAKRTFNTKANQLQIDGERMRRATAENETLISKTQNQLARIQSDTIQVESEYKEVSSRLAESKERKASAIADLKAGERNLASLRKNFQDSQNEFRQIEQQQKKLANDSLAQRTKILSEAKKLEMQTVENNIARMSFDADKQKFKNENEKLETLLVAAKARNEASKVELEHERGVILESRFKAEKSQTEIAMADSQNRKAKLDNDTLHIKLRNLASMASDSGMSDAPVKVWIMTKNCFLRTSASDDSEKDSLVKKSKVVGGQDEGNFVKVINTSGKPLYMPKGCVQERDASQ